MGQKVNAVGLRVGINRDWNSKWFANKQQYGKNLEEDLAIRKYLEKELAKSMLSRIEIGRVNSDKGTKVTVSAYVARPGDVLGQDGENLKKLKGDLATIVKKPNEIDLLIVEIKNPDLDATLMAKWIASELENRAAFRSTMKKALTRMRKAGAKGCRTLCSGRLGGAEIAREEGYKEGVIPLTTLRADIDFASVSAHTTYGCIGIKVWICRSLNKTDMAFVNEPAPESARMNRFDRRPGSRPGNHAPRNNNNASDKGGEDNAATKTR